MQCFHQECFVPRETKLVVCKRDFKNAMISIVQAAAAKVQEVRDITRIERIGRDIHLSSNFTNRKISIISESIWYCVIKQGYIHTVHYIRFLIQKMVSLRYVLVYSGSLRNLWFFQVLIPIFVVLVQMILWKQDRYFFQFLGLVVRSPFTVA